MTDIPDFPAMTGPELVAYCGDDARKWAEAFVNINGSGAADSRSLYDTMVTWFANAIETADDVRAKRMREQYHASGGLWGDQ